MKTINIGSVKLSRNAKIATQTTLTAGYFSGVGICMAKGAAAPFIAKAAVVAGACVFTGIVVNACYNNHKKSQLDKANFLAKAVVKEPVDLS